ncbi:MAG: hypothetical protein ACI4E1_05285 [Lachnospira sp.]
MKKKRMLSLCIIVSLLCTITGCNRDSIDDAYKLNDEYDALVEEYVEPEYTKSTEEPSIIPSGVYQAKIEKTVPIGETLEYAGYEFTINKTCVSTSVKEALQELGLYTDEVYEDVLQTNGPESLGGRLYGTHFFDADGISRFGEFIMIEMTIHNKSKSERTLSFGMPCGYSNNNIYIQAGILGQVYTNVYRDDYNDKCYHKLYPDEKVNKIIIFGDRGRNIKKNTVMSMNRVFGGASNPKNFPTTDIVLDLGIDKDY